MKSLAILIMLVVFLAPTITFAQQIVNEIKIEPIPDSTNIAVTIKGELQDEKKIRIEVFGTFDSIPNKSMGLLGQVTKDNPTMVFELDYPYLTNEIYHVSVTYASDGETIAWIPILSTQEISKNTNEELPLVLGQKQSTSVLVPNESAGLFVSLRDENRLLIQEMEKKDAVMMEQVMVIHDLATKISKVKFTNSVEMVSLMAGQAELTSSHESFDEILQIFTEENKMLSEEIEKKDAIIFEQLKVIQELAEKLSKVSFESTSGNFSLV